MGTVSSNGIDGFGAGMQVWKYLLVLVALASWLAKLSLEFISDGADWFWYLTLGCWFVLFFLACGALFRRRSRELAIFVATLSVTFVPALNIGVETVDRFQDEVVRRYLLYRVSAVPLEAFLSGCKSVHYVEDDGVGYQVGQCDLRFNARGTRFSMIYDPSGQFGLPKRSLAWRLAVGGLEKTSLSPGTFLNYTNRQKHLVGNFYYVKIYLEDWDG